MIIEARYIVESKRIIDNYNKAIGELQIYENTLSQNKNILIKMKNDIEKIKQTDDTDLLKKQRLFEVMSGYDKDIERLKTIIEPYITQLEALKKDSATLYGILKEVYPGATDKQLQEQIFKQMEEMEKTL